MTVKYTGMNRDTGEAVNDIDHIRQSVRDILLTPVGTRVMRRRYGRPELRGWFHLRR